MFTSIDVFSRVTDYIERRITLQELESWLVPMLPVYLANPDSAAAELVGAIELGLAELSAGILSERSVRKLLAKAQAVGGVSIVEYPEPVVAFDATSSASVTDATALDWLDPSRSWHTEPQVVNG